MSNIPSVQMQQQQQSVSLKSAAYSSKQNLSFEEDLEDEEGNLTCRFCQREFQVGMHFKLKWHFLANEKYQWLPIRDLFYRRFAL